MKTLCAALGLLLVLGLAAAPTATAHPLPDGWEYWHDCDEPTVGQTLDCHGGQVGGKVIDLAQHQCEHLFGSC